jgi:hypothetical protein
MGASLLEIVDTVGWERILYRSAADMLLKTPIDDAARSIQSDEIW